MFIVLQVGRGGMIEKITRKFSFSPQIPPKSQLILQPLNNFKQLWLKIMQLDG